MLGSASAVAQNHDHTGAGSTMNMPMEDLTGAYGNYPASREASGTAWVPDSSMMAGWHGRFGGDAESGESGEWATMFHGTVDLVYDDQGGPRGDEKLFSQSMLMAMGQRPLGGGKLGLRGMVSLDPTMGKGGYPLLFQTGETADGNSPLIDRQHPHDFFVELAASYSMPLGADGSVFVYLGYPGEPALGPPPFMHRASGLDNPEASLGHHWLDATHITFGVATTGYIWRNWKVEVSAFNGREPDQYRWNFDTPRFNSHSVRTSYNPTANWSLQLSRGHLKSPELLEPDVDQIRTSASATYDRPFGAWHWQTTFALGRNEKNPGSTTDALLLESSISLRDRHTLFARADYVEKDELFGHHGPLAGQIFDVGKLSTGYVYDIPIMRHVSLGLGGLLSVYNMPGELAPYYGDDPLSTMVFARLRIL